MPFKSESQRRYFYAAESRGDMPKGTAARWESETPKGKKLPEKVMEKSAFEVGFEKRALSIPMMAGAAVGKLGRSVSNILTAKAPNMPKMFQKPMGNIAAWGQKNKVGLGAATLGAGAVGLLGAGMAAKKLLSSPQPQQSPVPQQMPKFASNFAHAAELAGLGILAAPAASALAGHKWNEKAKDVAEVGGLGVLAAPSIAHFVSKNKKLAPYMKHLV